MRTKIFLVYLTLKFDVFLRVFMAEKSGFFGEWFDHVEHLLNYHNIFGVKLEHFVTPITENLALCNRPWLLDAIEADNMLVAYPHRLVFPMVDLTIAEGASV